MREALSTGDDQCKNLCTHSTSNTVHLNTLKSSHIVEIKFTKLRLLDHFGVESSLELHHQQKHLVVGTSWEENLAGIQLEKRAPNGPNIECWVIRYSEDYEECENSMTYNMIRLTY